MKRGRNIIVFTLSPVHYQGFTTMVYEYIFDDRGMTTVNVRYF